MEKMTQLYEGKAKKVYATEDAPPQRVYQELSEKL